MIPPNSAFHPIEFSLSLFVTLNSSLSKIGNFTFSNYFDLEVLQLSQALSGKARRKKLLSPKGIDVRPIMEVVKGAAFGILQAVGFPKRKIEGIASTKYDCPYCKI
ncbi:uncharacterized protein LOC21397802 isoform X2 [Morus notabilis]|uniref:uncharacterized protein LOC21397802 isoform X2 n=1 Tax=Morus notabilis TaxID=981085 RepID=UPI000CED07D8|nr:uncharacterized protein LOC21397802 isoform X2 [Morus notabilis]